MNNELNNTPVATSEVIVITRHAALVEYCVEIGLISPDTPVISHATISDVAGKRVIGVLPLSLARHALTVTEIPLDLTPEDRGKELSLTRVREIARPPACYEVRAV